MALQFSVEVRNAMLDAVETTTGTSAKLRMYTGTPPANTAAAATGTLLVDMTLPSDWLAAAASGTKALSGTWQTTASGGAPSNAGYYRIWNNGVTTCHEQGTITATGGGGDMTLDNISIATGQTVTITSKTLTAPNA
jgi:hypothetical protein